MTTTTRIKNIWLIYQKETGKYLDHIIRNAYHRHDDNDHIEYVEWLEDQLEKQLNHEFNKNKKTNLPFFHCTDQ